MTTMLQGIALLPRTCRTTLGKTGILPHDGLKDEAKVQLKRLVPAAREFLIQAAQHSAFPFQLPEAGHLVQSGQEFKRGEIVQLVSRSSTAQKRTGTSLDQSLLLNDVFLKVTGFHMEQPPAVSEADGRGQQSFSCHVSPVHAASFEFKITLGGDHNLLLKAKTPKDLSAKTILDGRPTRLAWLDSVKQVPSC